MKYYENQATGEVVIAGEHQTVNSNTTVAKLLDIGLLTIQKMQSEEVVSIGSVMTYTINIQNDTECVLTNFNFKDIIPAGMAYNPNTFEVDGQIVTPTLQGNTLNYLITELKTGTTQVKFDVTVNA